METRNKYHLTRTSPRVSDQSAEFYRELFGTLNSGMEFVGDAFPGLYARSIQAIRGVFTQGELLVMLESGNGVELHGMGSGIRFRKNVQLSTEIEKLDKRYGVDLGGLIRTLDNMTVFELACLELWVYFYWLGVANGVWEGYATKQELGKGVMKGKSKKDGLREALGCLEGLAPVYLAAMQEYSQELI